MTEDIQTPEYTEVELKAMEKGWRPESEFEGPEGEWRPAKEFLDRGELMDRISDQSRQLRSNAKEVEELKEAIQILGEHNRKISEREYEKAMADLKARKKEALSVDDYDSVVEVDEQMADLKDTKKKAEQSRVEEPQDQGPHPEILKWVEKNSWYNTDVVMQGAVDKLAEAYARNNPEAATNPSEMLKYIESTMKDEFPHKFNRRPAAVDSAEGTARGKAKTKFTQRDLSDEQRRVGKRFVDAGAFETMQEYIDQLAETGDLG